MVDRLNAIRGRAQLWHETAHLRFAHRRSLGGYTNSSDLILT
jgi:hypothetical protein